MSSRLDQLRSRIGFKKTPLSLSDGDIAFIDFLIFATGKNPIADSLADEFTKVPFAVEPSPAELVGLFVDWLIEMHWGEDPAGRAK